MPPRGNEGLDFTPILTHYLFLFTSFLAVAGWFTAFIAQCIVTSTKRDGGRPAVGSLWFAIFLQLFLILGVLYTLATDSISMNRFQISVFGAVAIVFAVDGVTTGIFAANSALNAMGAGWLILSIVDILWVLYFTSEEDSLAFYIFNLLGTGGLTPPSRRRRTRTQSSVHNMQSANGYPTNYGSGGGIGSNDGYDSKIGGGAYGSPNPALRTQNSFGGSLNDNTRSIGGGGAGSIHNQPSMGGPGSIGGADNGPSSPLMAGIGAGNNSNAGSNNDTQPPQPSEMQYQYKAKALYAYTANPDDPSEISFTKGEILDIMDKQGKWWQARKADGTQGIAPSNYLHII
ncbi:hypothetical protein CPB84DRAFT_1841633 [Gymnopilus junonius]|uniref:SH3 domain-containing protein n=1 Tax=Gymnopilus junonius TaxID=109634 RepID=A0A9P5P3I0_GYMJU|nr:hypothetical protein CPB84DRAFT_1841633 [Gymnopilus junonius]